MLPQPGAPLEDHNIGTLSQGKIPSIRFTPKDSTIYGYVDNVYFGPDMTTVVKSEINRKSRFENGVYTYSDRNMNSVKGERRHYFTPNNYATKKYVARSNGLQFYTSIPIYRMTISDAIDVSKKSNGIILCNKTPVNADPRSLSNYYNEDAQKNDKFALFEIVWIDKIPDVNHHSYNQAQTKTVTLPMFNTFKTIENGDLSQINYTFDEADGKNGLLYEKQDRKLSNNLFMNLLRLSIKSGRTAGVITYLGGSHSYSKKWKWTQKTRGIRVNQKGKRTRKN